MDNFVTPKYAIYIFLRYGGKMSRTSCLERDMVVVVVLVEEVVVERRRRKENRQVRVVGTQHVP